MEKIIPLLKYLEGINSSVEFIFCGIIPAKNTNMEYLNTFGKLSDLEFNIKFKKVSDFLEIDPNWIKDNGVVFNRVGWEGRIDRHVSSVNIYLNTPIHSINIKSDSQSLVNYLENFSHANNFSVFHK